ncbi:MAG TPA: TIGR02206 family membrane protein [Rhizomicrobium sp.]|nr:TIGR02206 family membrane protein [Rhizomicrobium sp.]
MSDRFVLFGAAHLAAIASAFVVPLVLSVATAFSPGPVFERQVRAIFAALLIGTWILWYWLLYERNWFAPGNLLPMHLCDWAAILTIFTLIRPNQRTYELAYFWALGGTLQALLTPDLRYGFPDMRFDIFFLFHSGIIAAVLYLTFGARFRPWPSSIPRVIFWSLVYLVSALAVNWLFKTNFGYLGAKPPGPSLFDAMAPWPWYIGELAVLGLISIVVYYAPFFVADRLRART